MSLLADLEASPPHLSVSSRFTVFNGLFYLAAGSLFMVWPGAVQALFRDPGFVGSEAPLVRVLGMTLAIIGWLYCFGGRSGGRQVVAASVLDRVLLVPLILVPAALGGLFPHTFGTFAVLDPVLGLVAWRLLARERQARQPSPAAGAGAA